MTDACANVLEHPLPGKRLALPAGTIALRATAPIVGVAVAGCPWWGVAVVGLVTVFFYGAEPAMRWLDVRDRLDRSAGGG